MLGNLSGQLLQVTMKLEKKSSFIVLFDLKDRWKDTQIHVWLGVYMWSEVIHDTRSVQISQNQDRCNIYAIM